mgnify:CR=1 FL=1
MKNLKKHNPLISILMPVYNAGDFLMEAIKSIKKQTYENWELIAIDDGSTDSSFVILKKFAKKDKRIRIFKLGHKGLSYALNVGLEKVRGQFIARMDADDISHPKRLEKQLNFLIQNKEIMLIGTQVTMMDEKGKKIGDKRFPQNHEKIYQMMMTMMSVQHATILARTNFFKKVAYQNHSTAEDVSLLFKMIQTGKFANTKEFLYKYRVRKNSNSHKNPKKTFYLTLKSRIKAIIEWGYKPAPIGIITNILQFIFVSLMPETIILSIYKFMRFDYLKYKKQFNIAIKKLTENLDFSFKKIKSVILVK